MPTRTRLISLARLGRPHFLAGGFLLHALGIAIALFLEGSLNLSALIWGQVAITSAQWMVHYANEYFDLAADQANPTRTVWAGGSGVLVAGTLNPRTALVTAGVLAAVALTASLILTLFVRTGPLTLPIIWLALALGWSYSAPPLKLHSRGLGELTIAFAVAGLTPVLGAYLQTGRISTLSLLVVIPLAFLQFAQAIAIEFPDRVGDAAAGKQTLVVRLGGSKSARLAIVSYLLAYALLPLLLNLGLPSLVVLASICLAPLAAWHCWRFARGRWADPSSWDSLSFWSIAIVMATAALQTVALLILSLLQVV